MAKRLKQVAAEMADDGVHGFRPAPEPKKRGRPPRAAPPVSSNVNDETIAAAIVECGAARNDLDVANAHYRNALKKWGERGVPPEHVTWLLKQKKREVADIEQMIRWQNRMLAIAAIPVGSQLGLFDDGESVGTRVDKARAVPIAAADDIVRAKREGYDAGARGDGEDANPYDDGSPLALAWSAERRRATVDRAGEVFGTAKTAEELAGEAADEMRALRAPPN